MAYDCILPPCYPKILVLTVLLRTPILQRHIRQLCMLHGTTHLDSSNSERSKECYHHRKRKSMQNGHEDGTEGARERLKVKPTSSFSPAFYPFCADHFSNAARYSQRHVSFGLSHRTQQNSGSIRAHGNAGRATFASIAPYPRFNSHPPVQHPSPMGRKPSMALVYGRHETSCKPCAAYTLNSTLCDVEACPGTKRGLALHHAQASHASSLAAGEARSFPMRYSRSPAATVCRGSCQMCLVRSYSLWPILDDL